MPTEPLFDGDARGAVRRTRGVPLDVPFEQLDGQAAARSCCTARASNGSTSIAGGKRQERRAAAVPLSIQGALPGAGRGRAAFARACAASWDHLVDEVECSTCGGSRLRDDASAVRLRDRTIDELVPHAAGRVARAVRRLEARRAANAKIAGELVREVRNRLQFLVDVGLEYLTLVAPRSDALGRRGAAHSPGQPGRQRVVRRAVRARRADDRAAPARQPPAARGAGKAARLGQHAAGGRARSRGDRRRRSVARFRPGGRRAAAARSSPAARRRKVGQAKALGHRARICRARRRLPCRRNRRMAEPPERQRRGSRRAKKRATQSGKSRRQSAAESAASPSRPAAAGWRSIGARHNNLRNVDAADSAGHVDGGHRRQRQRQELAGRGRALQLAGPHAAPRPHDARRRTTRFAASSRSTR